MRPDATPQRVTDRVPFFVVGAGRSGTTLLRLMLDAHPRLAVPPESHFIVDLTRAADCEPPGRRGVEALLAHPRFAEWEVDPDRLRSVFASVPPESWRQLFSAAFELYAEDRGKPRWGDKTPDYARHLPVLWSVFPEARIIHILRDGRDVACSLARVPWFEGNAAEAALEWMKPVARARRAGDGRDEYLEVRYEELVRDPEAVLRRVCQHISEVFDPAMLDYPDTARQRIPERRQAWHQRTAQPVSDDRVGVWRRQMSKCDLYLFEQRAAMLLADTGYPPTGRFSWRGAATVARRRLHRLAGLLRLGKGHGGAA